MLAVPGIPPTSSRFAHYVRGYQVVEKIQAAKRAGTFDATVAAPDTPGPARLAALIECARIERARYVSAARPEGVCGFR